MSKRQLAMVMDLNKCIGCQTCTSACKTQWTNRNGREYMYWNNVETHPGNGYPRKWQEAGGGFDESGNLKPGRIPDLHQDYGAAFDMNYDVALNPLGKKVSGELPHLAPVRAPDYAPNWDEDQGAGEYPNSYYFYLPRICNHCTNPACLAACPRKAIYKREEDGIVLIDQERCRGYQHCVAACPYKKVYFNPLFKRSEKCIFCFPRIEQGLPPACAHQCVGRIRFVGYLDDAEGPVQKLVEKWKVALPLHAELGTQPNVYYVPPLSPYQFDTEGKLTNERRIPDAFLISLFGPRVPEVLKTLESEREKRRRGEPSELMDLLIAYRHADMFKLDAAYYQKPADPAVPSKAAAKDDTVVKRRRVIPIVAAESLEERLEHREIAAGNGGGGVT
ncbi:MAG: 4Fe-4S dicluster domain-containing protein [Gammaproteobacteria bacterium]|nr:MAG: 4Fe-4S dicluster domain-containing protein [Gammaproteobacteria bacterium]